MTAPASLEDALGVSFADRDLLELALTHRSYAFEAGGLPTNERLEFLGDAVLGLAVTERIYLALPDAPEGQLAKIRASAVNTRSLAGVARELRLGELVHLGRGEEQSGGRDKDSILADTLEAVLGAVYLDQGLETASELIGRLFGSLLEDLARRRDALDHKTALQELTAAADAGLPVYLVSEEGPDHDKQFTAVVEVEGETLGQGVGRSKKDAEQGAAREAYGTLRQRWEATPSPPQDGGHR